MRLSLKSIVIATAALGAFGLAQGQLPDWVKYVRSTSGFSEAFFRPVALPGGPLFTRRPPVETVEWLAARIEATPNNAQLYALRARESERLLDFAAADNDWNEFAAQVADPAEGQLALADFYRRRLRPVDEVEDLLAVGRSPSSPSERFSPANQQGGLKGSMQHFTEKEEWMQEEQKEQTRKRRSYTAAEFAEVWDRWGRGESSKKIARVMDRGPSVYWLLLRYGGIRPRTRCRSPQALTLAEREEVSRGLVCGQSLRQIARRLSRAPSTLSREVRRNGGSNRYRAAEADKQAWKRARRPKRCLLLRCPQLRQL